MEYRTVKVNLVPSPVSAKMAAARERWKMDERKKMDRWKDLSRAAAIFAEVGLGNETNSQTACPPFLLDDVIRRIILGKWRGSIIYTVWRARQTTVWLYRRLAKSMD